ncbi:MAG TPA: hypothetical protein DDX29_03635 [Clostridiales bacterium]|nr:hypothetical protein [Clostridiales bacterium]
MPEKHTKRIYLIFVFILWTCFLLACNLSSTAIQKTNQKTTTEPNDFVYQDVITQIESGLKYNQTEIKLNPEDFKYLENPIGEGIFIYEPVTRFFGVERFFIWVYLDNNIYVVNGATRGVTPNILVARDVPSDVWDPTNISPYSATDLIEYIFEGKELIPWTETHGPTHTPYPEILFGYSTEERKQIFYDLIKAEDKASAEKKSSSLYHQEVADMYDLTLEQLDQIGDEGILNHWPMPPIP